MKRMDARGQFPTPGEDAVRDGRHLFPNDGGMPDETLALKSFIHRWHGEELNALKRLADDFKYRPDGRA